MLCSEAAQSGYTTQLTLVVVEAVLALRLEGVLAVDAGPARGAGTAANEGGGEDEFMVSGARGCLILSTG